MMTFYSAIGSYRIKNVDGHKMPYIQRLGKLHPISTYAELKKHYDEQIAMLEGPKPDFDQLLGLLVKRKLVAKGIGYTGQDALYNISIIDCYQ